MLDPFSGMGTSALTACGMGLQGTGIEIMPVGNLAARAITAASNGLEADAVRAASDRLLGAISRERYKEAFLFPHVPITMHAFRKPRRGTWQSPANSRTGSQAPSSGPS